MSSHPLLVAMRKLEAEIIGGEEDQKEELAVRLADYFYQILAIEPFTTFFQNDPHIRTQLIFPKPLHSSQHLSCPTSLPHRYSPTIKDPPPSSFFRLLHH